MSNHFARIQGILSSRPDLQGKWHLLTISFDPKFDTPKVLSQYGKSYKADFSTWDFATDPDSAGKSILRIADGLDLTFADDEGLIQHNLRTVLLDRKGKLVEIVKGNEWTSEEIAAKLQGMVETDR